MKRSFLRSFIKRRGADREYRAPLNESPFGILLRHHCQGRAEKSVVSFWRRALTVFGAVILMSAPLTSQGASPSTFGTGQILQQVQPTIPPPQVLPKPKVFEKKPPTKPLPTGLSIFVRTFKITGNTLFKTNILHHLVEKGEGQKLTFKQIQFYANKITSWYKDHGYPLSRAIIPRQTVIKGVITIQVVEVKYGHVRIFNRSRVDPSLLDSTFSGIHSGLPVDGEQLDNKLLLLSDIPGVQVVSTLAPGIAPETTDLDVDVLPTPMVSGDVSVDDYGDPYTGSLRLNGNLLIKNIFHHGDVLSVNASTAFGGFNYGRISYEVLLNGYGTRIGAGYSALDYRLGGGITPIAYSPTLNTLLALGANGYGQTIAGWINQPLIRRSNRTLVLHLEYDRFILSDTIDQSAGIVDNRSLDVMTINLMGSEVDHFLGRGSSNISLMFVPCFNEPSGAVQSFFPVPQGENNIWRGLIDRTQILPGENNSLYFSANGQLANGIIDPAEQYVMGGPQSVRAYSTAVLFGNEGFATTAELRHAYQMSTLPGTFQSTLFFDAGGISYSNSFLTLMGPGAGETWQAPYGWLAKVEVSVPIGGVPQLVGSTSPIQAWFEVEKDF